MNTVILIGHLTRDMEVAYSKTGTAIGKFTIAVNTYVSKDNQETLFLDCVIFGERAEKLKDYLKKGTKVSVSGRLAQSNWVDKNGSKRTSYHAVVSEIEFCSNSNSNKDTTQTNTTSSQSEPEPTMPSVDIDDSEIPF